MKHSLRGSISVKIRTRSDLLLPLNSWGTHPANFRVLLSLLRQRRVIEGSTLKLSASIHVIRVSSPSTAAKSDWSSEYDGGPVLCLSSKPVSSDLKRAIHSLHRLSLIVPAPKSSLRSRNDCAAVHPFSKWCSITR